MIVKSIFIYFVIFPTIAFVSFPNSLNVSLEQRVANEDIVNLFRTNVSTVEEEITDGEGGDARERRGRHEGRDAGAMDQGDGADEPAGGHGDGRLRPGVSEAGPLRARRTARAAGQASGEEGRLSARSVNRV